MNKLKILREKTGKSQEELAKVLNVSRPTYASLEADKQKLSLPEAEKLSNFFGIDLGELATGITPMFNKYRQMIFFFLRNIKDKKNDGKIPKTKLAKLLYLADFAWYYKHLESMSGMQYRKITYGPVPDSYFRVIEELLEEGKLFLDKKEKEDGGKIFLLGEDLSNKNLKLNLLSTKENLLLNQICQKWGLKSTQEIVNFTHNQLPYQICRDGEIIPYGIIIQEEKENLI